MFKLRKMSLICENSVSADESRVVSIIFGLKSYCIIPMCPPEATSSRGPFYASGSLVDEEEEG